MVCALKPECGLAVDTLTIFRCDALCLGAMLAVVMYQGDRIPQMVWLAKRSLPILALVALGVVLSGKRWLTIPHTLFPLLWVAMMGWVVTQDKSQLAARALRGKALQWMGKYSYGMYVIQLPLVTLLPLSPVLSSMGWSSQTPVGCALYVASMLALICGFAYATFHLLEKRFLNLKRFFPSE
jgi:peptidoglycan/LPS O-acetylase OafA/YrhL